MNAITTIETTKRTKVPEHMKNIAQPLPVYSDGQSSYSVWELTEAELDMLLKTRKLYLIVLSPPDKHPPVGITVLNPLTHKP